MGMPRREGGSRSEGEGRSAGVWCARTMPAHERHEKKIRSPPTGVSSTLALHEREGVTMRGSFLSAIYGLSMISVGVAACGDNGSGSSATGGSTTTSSSSTTMGGAGGSTSTGGTGGTTSSGGSTSTGGTTGGTGGATGGTGGTTTTSGPTYGYCTKPCGTVADCCPAGAQDCPSNVYPNNWHCESGACLSPECMSTADCTAMNPSLDCLSFSGAHSCALACSSDGDCTAPLTCAGVDDNGAKYCKVVGGGCTDNTSCGGFGECKEKACVCDADNDCTAPGYNKCAL